MGCKYIKNWKRKSKKPFSFRGRMQYPRLVDAEKRKKADEIIIRNPKIPTWIIIKTDSLKKRKF